MPFIKIFTNLSKDKFPPSLVVAFIGKMAPILGKDPSICNWSLETDRTMSKGATNAHLPYTLVEIHSLKVFDDRESCQKYAPQLFKAFEETTGQPEDRVHFLFQKLESYQIGVDGNIKG